MIPRLFSLPDEASFFLFGPRGVGKTTLIKHAPWFSKALYLNPLKTSAEQQFILLNRATTTPNNFLLLQLRSHHALPHA